MFLQPLLCVPSSDAPSGIPLGAEGAEDVRWQADAIQAQTGPFLVHFLTLGQFYHGYFSPRWHTETWWDHMTIWGQQRAVPHGELLLQVQVVQHLCTILLLAALLRPSSCSRSVPRQAFLDGSCALNWSNTCTHHCC